MSDDLLVTCSKCSNKFQLDEGSCNVCRDVQAVQPESFNIHSNKSKDETQTTYFREVPNASSEVKGKRQSFSFFSAPVAIIGFSLVLLAAIFIFNSWKDSQPTQSYKKGWEAGYWVANEDPFKPLPGLDERKFYIDICMQNYEIDKNLVKSKSEYMTGCKDALELSD